MALFSKLALRVFVLTLAVVFSTSLVRCSKFDEQFQPSWASDHVIFEGELLKLKLDSCSGAGFSSKSKYIHGKATAEMKLVPGDSAGTVTAFYVSSDGTAHNELDFEFLGNTTGEPYLVQTNIYVNGTGNREQRMDLWFDPTAEFHTYSIEWSERRVVFAVDGTPVRVYENRADKGLAFPAGQQMGMYSSIWNADDWATQGGRVKTDWTHAPFVTTFRDVKMEEAWAPAAEELSVHQSHQLVWARARHLVYDYCFDAGRFPVAPPECVR